MRHAAHRDTLAALHPDGAAPDPAAAAGFDPLSAPPEVGVLGAGPGDDVVTVTYPDSSTQNGGKGTDTLVVHWGDDPNNVYLDLTADAAKGGYDGTVTDSASSATVRFNSFERFDVHTGAGADAVTTGDGADTLDGGAGKDLLTGGAGDDLYVVDDSGDVLIENAGGGTDTVQASISFTLADNFENLTLTGGMSLSGTGNAAANRMIANDGGDSLQGLDGDDSLIGGAGADSLYGGAGVNRLEGGSGNDAYHISSNDLIVEQADGGVDTVYVSVKSYQMADNLENAYLVAVKEEVFGNDLDNVLYGDPNRHGGRSGTLHGGAGDDTLSGGTAMYGGTGDDYYATASSQIFENPGEGNDTVRATGSFTLPDNVENLVLDGYDFLNNKGTGNALNNMITGDTGDNVLRGEAGGDTLIGGAGLDTASYSDATSAVTVSLAIEGVQHTRGAGADSLSQIEGLDGSAFADTLSGDDGANVLTGNAGADTLSGAGGADQLNGGDDADSLVGGDGADVLTGGAGADTLYGGAGADKLIGGDGDRFVYAAASDSTAAAADTLTLGSSDVIDLNRIDADTTQAGDQAFHRVAALDGHAGELVLVQNDSGQTLLEGDVDGDGQADLYVVISGAHTDFNNFVL